MPATVRDATAVVELLRQQLVGREVRALEVYGINSLKSREPALGSLAGLTVRGVAPSGGSVVAIQLDGMEVVVDLQRVGGVQLSPRLDGWSFGDGPQPTARLLLADGGGVDFKEPSKTKRITVRLVPSGQADP